MNVIRMVKKAKKGNKEALLQLILHKKDEFYRLAWMYMGNSDDALDAMQEMIAILYEKIDRLKKDESFYSWSKTILVNECKTLLQNRKTMVSIGEWGDSEKTILNIEGKTQPQKERERQLDIQQWLHHLSEGQKEAIQLRYFHDLDYQTIANMLDIPLGTVKSRIHQGLKKLKNLFEEEER